MQNSRIPDPSPWLRDRYTHGFWSAQLISLAPNAAHIRITSHFFTISTLYISSCDEFSRIRTSLEKLVAAGSGRCCLSDLDARVVSVVSQALSWAHVTLGACPVLASSAAQGPVNGAPMSVHCGNPGGHYPNISERLYRALRAIPRALKAFQKFG